MILPEYLADVAAEMRNKSAAIRRDFATHRLSAGENREDLVEQFLKEHLPRKFGVSRGLVISKDGVFSNQADVLIVDEQNNAPLHGTSRNKIWPVEAVYALIEVKTSLGPSDLADAVRKCRKFKSLKRQFCDAGQPQRISDSLFVIWGFNSPSTETAKRSLETELASVPRLEQPDFVVAIDKFLATSGSYLEVSELGQRGSPYRSRLEETRGRNIGDLLPDVVHMHELNDNALMGFFVWFDAWLRQAGSRLASPVSYLPPGVEFGRMV